MSDSTTRSDYFFLEEVLNNLPKNRKRARIQETSSKNSSKKSRRLIQQAERRGINLQMMPSMMERHKKNSSWYCAPRNQITWKVEIVVHPENRALTFQVSEYDENLFDTVSENCQKNGI